MSKKKLTKQIKDIAGRLPRVKERHVSGYTGTGKEAEANVYDVEVNHERRLRKAYEAYGMEGLYRYLESINKLQIQRNEELLKESDKV